jgi:GNAT superfamily N-acetyltransferase
MEEITYRQATAADVRALAALRWQMAVEQHGAGVPLEDYATAYEASLLAGPERGTHQAWLAEADGQVVGCVLLIWWAMPPSFDNFRRKRGYVSSVYTVPEYRRLGLARRLMTLLIDAAREQGIQRLLLNASDMGRPLYESLGFVTPSREMELNL